MKRSIDMTLWSRSKPKRWMMTRFFTWCMLAGIGIRILRTRHARTPIAASKLIITTIMWTKTKSLSMMATLTVAIITLITWHRKALILSCKMANRPWCQRWRPLSKRPSLHPRLKPLSQSKKLFRRPNLSKKSLRRLKNPKKMMVVMTTVTMGVTIVATMAVTMSDF